MKTVTIHFTGGAPYALQMPAEAAEVLIKALSIEHDGKTHITNDSGLSCLVNRAQITYVEAV